MKLRVGCELSYKILAETVFIFNIEVARLQRHLNLSEKLIFTPGNPSLAYEQPDLRNRYVQTVAQVGDFHVSYAAEVEIDPYRADPSTVGEIPIKNLPLDILPYLLPSRFAPSDELVNYAMREFGQCPHGHERVAMICNWLYENIEYQRGSSDAKTGAIEILVQRAGVCRDFAHLGIAFCRALGIPARYVTCYAFGLQPPDFHAVFEAYLDGRWWLFDGTRQAALDGLVRIGVGRDAAEVAFATPFGLIQPGPVKVWIERTDGTAECGPRTTDAISTEETGQNGGVF
ncbi:transglutaminase family protein [Methylocella sp.]|uniref:transglutaminase family protein n=1 Tax=Methylocella sp. TaxID=1978226 RepID=UPI003783A771